MTSLYVNVAVVVLLGLHFVVVGLVVCSILACSLVWQHLLLFLLPFLPIFIIFLSLFIILWPLYVTFPIIWLFLFPISLLSIPDVINLLFSLSKSNLSQTLEFEYSLSLLLEANLTMTTRILYCSLRYCPRWKTFYQLSFLLQYCPRWLKILY